MTVLRPSPLILFALLVALFGPDGPPAHAQQPTALYFQETQTAAGRADPTGDPGAQVRTPTRPLALAGLSRLRVLVCAPAGYTLTGSGTVRLWLYDPVLGWGYNPSYSLAVTVSGAKCQPYGLQVDVRRGYLHPAAVAVGVSGGASQVTLRVDGDAF